MDAKSVRIHRQFFKEINKRMKSAPELSFGLCFVISIKDHLNCSDSIVKDKGQVHCPKITDVFAVLVICGNVCAIYNVL